METAQIVASLKNQFFGASVLYAKDLAVVLGKSEKAVSNLISRNSLPFKVKILGGRRCVNIYEVAQWLCADESSPQEVTALPKQGRVPRVKDRSQFDEGSIAVTPGTMTDRIRQMRHDHLVATMRWIGSLLDSDEKLFMLEVIETHFYSHGELESSYKVSVRKIAPSGYKLRGHDEVKYFQSESQASDFLLRSVTNAVKSAGKFMIHFELSHLGDELFQAAVLGHTVTLLSNDAELPLPSGWGGEKCGFDVSGLGDL